MTYDVRLESGAEHDLSHIPRDVMGRIDSKLIALGNNPRPRGVVKLQGREGAGWRIRVGEYRILYTVDDDAHIVSVYRIRPRGNAYK